MNIGYYHLTEVDVSNQTEKKCQCILFFSSEVIWRGFPMFSQTTICLLELIFESVLLVFIHWLIT